MSLKGLRVVSFLCVLFFHNAFAFEWVNKKTSYLENHFVNLNLGLGATKLTNDSAVTSDYGFTIHVGAAHQLSQVLQVELFYQFSIFDLVSPDPLNTAVRLKTGADMHETGLRFLAMYPAVAVKPYLGVGLGGYGLGTSEETGLNFDFNLELPVSAGLQAYIYKDLISLDFDFTYKFFFSQNQTADVLSLLNVKEVKFNNYNITAGVQFHFF